MTQYIIALACLAVTIPVAAIYWFRYHRMLKKHWPDMDMMRDEIIKRAEAVDKMIAEQDFSNLQSEKDWQEDIKYRQRKQQTRFYKESMRFRFGMFCFNIGFCGFFIALMPEHTLISTLYILAFGVFIGFVGASAYGCREKYLNHKIGLGWI